MSINRPPPDQQQRELIVCELDRSMLVEAAAGTGKTTAMIRRMVALLAGGRCCIDTLAAVTFTRKAAAEIRVRFQVALEQAVAAAEGTARDRLRAALEHIDECTIGTIHSFCARLLRQRPIEAGVEIDFTEIDEDTDRQLRQRAWRQYVDSLIATDDPLVSELEELGLKIERETRWTESIVDELQELGLEVAQLGPAFMKLAEFPDVQKWPTPHVELPDLEPARQELRRYAQHMADLLVALPADPGTDKLMPKYRQIIGAMACADLQRPAELMEVLEQFCGKAGVVHKFWPGKKTQAKAEEKRWDEFSQVIAEPLLQAWREYRYEAVMRAIRGGITEYDRLREERGVLSFQDLLLKSAALLRDKPQVRRYFRERFTHLLVDEFQDTDPIQAEVMLLLTSDDAAETNWQRCRPVDGSLFVVGDPKQSIYRFRRADIVTYRKVKQIIQASGGLIVSLSTSFRSTQPLITWINDTFDDRFPAEATDHCPAKCNLLWSGEDVLAGDLAGIHAVDIPPHVKTVAEVADFEASLIARTIRTALDRGQTLPRTRQQQSLGMAAHACPGDFLIITRRKQRLSVYGRKLQELGIPHQVTGGSSVNQLSELELLCKCLRAVTRPDDPVSLLATLRSVLFGISDTALYAFKKLGGRFSFYSQIPEGLESDAAVALADAFTRLQKYAGWLRNMPAAAAAECVAADLGLAALACTTRAGPMQAGSLSKALELLRVAQQGARTSGEMIDYLEQMLDQEATHDGLPVLASRQLPVRVMNLHKAKGLEAAVVFLADPTGDQVHPVLAHIDRTGEVPAGYLAVYGLKHNKWADPPLLAHPPGWSQLAAEEQRYLDAENDRLLYVAATRAGSQLVISRRPNGKNNPWQFFEPYLDQCPTSESAEADVPHLPDFSTVAESEFADAARACQQRWQRALGATYDTVAAKTLALPSGLKPHGVGEHGTEWGSVIHALLEAAMARPHADLKRLALAALQDQELDAGLADTALEAVAAVTQSAIWPRALASQHCLVEVPFSTLLPSSADPGPTIVRGVIDLAFLEPPGWVIVDYKTEHISATQIPALANYYRHQLTTYAETWQRIVGQNVHETGLFFTHLGQYVRL